MVSKGAIIPNSEWENNNHVDDGTSEDRTISDNKSSLVSDEQEIEVDETPEVQHSTSTGRLSLSAAQSLIMSKKRTPAENQGKLQQFYNLRRGRPLHITPSELLAEVAADNNIDKRLQGWKLHLLGKQMDSLSDIETRNVEVLSVLLVRNACVDYEDDEDEDYDSDDEAARYHRRQYHDMIEQSKTVRENMQLARLQTMRILIHKPRVTSIVEKAIRKADEHT